MSKSQGTGISPNEVVKSSGADILRLWVASSDYHEDVRVSEEILERTVDAYRKIRNTARYALGNLHGFEPASQSVPESDLLELDRWVLAELDDVISRVWHAYEAYEFHMATRAIYSFCTVTLSARYFDIIKDRLYTSAPASLARRSAQTALYQIADALARLLAPILAFTSDEIWENLPADGRAGSVHLSLLPNASRETHDRQLLNEWDRLFQLRDQVLGLLEQERNQGTIGSSLRARVVIDPRLEDVGLLEKYWDDLKYIFIVSQVRRANEGELGGAPVLTQFKVEIADGDKCERCWNYSTRVGESSRYPTVCERCVEALQEIEQSTAP
jgi:isoleucyl-tRNA synthetase